MSAAPRALQVRYGSGGRRAVPRYPIAMGLLDLLAPQLEKELAALTASLGPNGPLVTAIAKAVAAAQVAANQATPVVPPPPANAGLPHVTSPGFPLFRRILEGPWRLAAPQTAADSINILDENGVRPAILTSAGTDYIGCMVEFLPPSAAVGTRSTINEILVNAGNTTIYLNDNMPTLAAQGDPFIIIERPDEAQDVRTPLVVPNLGAGGTLASFQALFTGTWTCLLALPTSSTVSLAVTPAGGATTVTALLYNGLSLTDGNWYAFEWPASVGASYKLTVTSAQTGNALIAIKGVPA